MTAKRSLENKKILITGASGFIGHALASSLSTQPCSIIRASRDKTRLLPLDGAATIYDREVDYSDPSIWQALLDGVDIVFFLGAQTSASDADADPLRDYEANVRPLIALLEHCKASGSKPAIIFASTATVVGLSERQPVVEGTYENPITVYDIHKLSCEKYLSYYASMHYVESCSLRLPNVYGPGTTSGSADRGILNLMMRRAAQGECLTIYGDGKQLRDYTYISDVVRAFEAAAVHIDKTNGRYFNIGSGEGHSLAQAFNAVCEEIRLSRDIEVAVEHVAAPASLSAIESRNYVADSSNFSKATAWSAAVDLRSGIRKTLDFYLD